jgi:hypothetical protein
MNRKNNRGTIAQRYKRYNCTNIVTLAVVVVVVLKNYTQPGLHK